MVPSLAWMSLTLRSVLIATGGVVATKRQVVVKRNVIKKQDPAKRDLVFLLA